MYNFWEPLHFLEQGYRFQTYELPSKFARSWANILLHYLPPRVGQSHVGLRRQITILTLLPGDNLSFLDVLPNYSPQNQRSRGALYFFMMFFSAGMWSASTCSFVFHECMKSDLLHQLSCHLRSPFIPLPLAFTYAFTPNSSQNILGP